MAERGLDRLRAAGVRGAAWGQARHWIAKGRKRGDVRKWRSQGASKGAMSPATACLCAP